MPYWYWTTLIATDCRENHQQLTNTMLVWRKAYKLSLAGCGMLDVSLHRQQMAVMSGTLGRSLHAEFDFNTLHMVPSPSNLLHTGSSSYNGTQRSHRLRTWTYKQAQTHIAHTQHSTRLPSEHQKHARAPILECDNITHMPAKDIRICRSMCSLHLLRGVSGRMVKVERCYSFRPHQWLVGVEYGSCIQLTKRWTAYQTGLAQRVYRMCTYCITTCNHLPQSTVVIVSTVKQNNNSCHYSVWYDFLMNWKYSRQPDVNVSSDMPMSWSMHAESGILIIYAIRWAEHPQNAENIWKHNTDTPQIHSGGHCSCASYARNAVEHNITCGVWCVRCWITSGYCEAGSHWARAMRHNSSWLSIANMRY